MKEKKDKILIIEDNQEYNDLISKFLRYNNYDVVSAFTGEEGKSLFYDGSFDLVILDLDLPDMHGFDILKDFTEHDNTVRVLILTSNQDVSTEVEGLNLGASDYLFKVVEINELEARVAALLKKEIYMQKFGDLYKFPDFTYDEKKRVLSANGESVMFTKVESRLLCYFLNYPDRFISKEELINHNWNDEDLDSGRYGSFNVFISHIRDKISPLIGYCPIITKIGVGLKFSSKKIENPK